MYTFSDRLKQILSILEAVFGLIVSFLLAVCVLLSALIIGFERSPSGILEGLARYSLMIAICLLEVFHIYALCKAVERKSPSAVAVALALPKMPLLLRPPVALFWLIHLFFTMGFIWAAQQYGARTENLLLRATLTLLAAGLSFVAFGYFLNAVAAVKPDETTLQKVWHNRRWYALVIAVLVIVLPYTPVVSDSSLQ